MWTIGEYEVSTVAVVDDDPASRESIGWVLSDSDLEMRELSGPLVSIIDTQNQIFLETNALICDHYLRSRNYAKFTGAELVSECIKSGSLAILCTRFGGSDIDDIRRFLRYIPIVRSPDELNEPEELHEALTLCAEELDGNVPPERKIWRAQLVVERIEEIYVDVSIPSWQLEKSIRLRVGDIPLEIRPKIKIGYRTHIWANLGAEMSDQFFISWSSNA